MAEKERKPDNLIGGIEFPLMTTAVTIEAGQGVLPRGAVLGKVTETGNYKLSDKAASDGSQIASVILMHETDTAEEVNAICYKTGVFHRNALTVAEGSIVEDFEEQLTYVGIHLKKEM